MYICRVSANPELVYVAYLIAGSSYNKWMPRTEDGAQTHCIESVYCGCIKSREDSPAWVGSAGGVLCRGSLWVAVVAPHKS